MAATEQKASNLNLTAYLIGYHSQQDKALGLAYPGTQTRLLAWYHQSLMRDIAKEQIAAAFRHGAITKAQSRMSQIMKEAKNKKTTLARRRQLLAEATCLKEFVEKLDNV